MELYSSVSIISEQGGIIMTISGLDAAGSIGAGPTLYRHFDLKDTDTDGTEGATEEFSYTGRHPAPPVSAPAPVSMASDPRVSNGDLGVSMNDDQAAFIAHILANRQGYIPAEVSDVKKNRMAVLNQEQDDRNALTHDVQGVVQLSAISVDARDSNHTPSALMQESIHDYTTQQDAGHADTPKGAGEADDIDVSG